MISITLTGITGTPPYVISICDITKTNCYNVFTGNPTLPLFLEVPSQLSTANQVLINIVDSQNCEYFQLISCIPPSPTPSQTPTPTPSPTPSDCLCLTFENTTLNNLNIIYTRCDGTVVSETIYVGTVLYYCGSSPRVDSGVNVTIGSACISNACPDPSPTPSSTPTSTPSFTPTPTPTPTPNILKQFQSGEDFNFQDGPPYDFQDT